MHRIKNVLLTITIMICIVIVVSACAAPTAQPAGQQSVVTNANDAQDTSTQSVNREDISVKESATSTQNIETVPVLVATAIPTEETTDQEPTDWLTVATTDGSFYVLGDPNAPIRLVDYSDFL